MKKGITFLTTVIGTAVGAVVSGKIAGRTINQRNEKVNKYKSYYNMLNQWLVVKQEGRSLNNYFKEKNYETIAIYGMGEMGNRFYDEIRNGSVKVAYAIDKNAAYTYSDLEVLDLNDELPPVDAVIVSAIFDFDNIISDLEELVSCPVISLEDVVYES